MKGAPPIGAVVTLGGNRLHSPAFGERGVDDPIQHLGERRSPHGLRIGAGAGGLNR